jgi:hypothetical protein
MRIIKLALISFVFIFLILTGMSLFIPSHIRISRATNLLAERDSIFALVNDSSKWKLWNPLFQGNARFPAPDIQTRVLEKSDTMTKMEFYIAGKNTLLNSWQLHHYSSTDSVTLQWYMDFHNKWYPWEKFRSLFYESTYGNMMETGLNNIKARLEQ